MRFLFAFILSIAGASAGADDQPYPLAIRVGKSIAICKTGTISCPAASPICDDTSVVEASVAEEGLVFKGLKPGTTLCSAANAGGAGLRRVYRVTVSP
jgi:hypothetical protein